MLILTRRVGETIVIGDDVGGTVLGIKGNQVRIGINAPKDVSVHREEIYQRIQQEKNATSGTGTTTTKPEESTTATTATTATTSAPASTATVTVRKKRESKIDKSENKDKE